MADLGSSKVFGDLTVTGEIKNQALEGTLDGKVGTGDTRLTNSREWTAETVAQVEAEAGTSTVRRAWTSQRVRQAINAVVNAIGNATTTVKGWMSPEDKAKLDGIETGATKNATDAQLRDRATHTGTQAISTVSGLQTALDGKSAVGHIHDDRYYTKAQGDGRYAGITHDIKNATALNTSDLNTITAPGFYYQHANANTSTARNYPVLVAGTLTVTTAAGVVQTYIPYGSPNTIYMRGYYGSSWSAWVRTYTTGNLTPESIGAAPASHNHSAADITSGTLAGARLPNATDTVQGAVKVRLNGTTAYFTTNGSNA
jgi:hypothetical protein